MKKGFTLIELLVVISIISIASVSCIISFNKVNKSTKEEELVSSYKQVQTSAMVYMEINDKLISEFTSNKEIYIPYMTLLSENFITDDIDSNIKDTNKGNLYIKIYVSKDSDNKEYVTSEIVRKSESNFTCYKNINGKDC